MSIIHLDQVENVTLYTGDNGSAYCTCNCPCCSQKGRDRHYQGTLKQALEMFEKLPNLKQLYLFGNPDVTVDPEFCNAIMKEAVKRKIRVCFSTSGVGGEKILQKLLKDIRPEAVDYISFSFDSITKEGMSIAKGINYPMKNALEGLEWAIAKGYTVKVQPTLWSFNYKKTSKIICFFEKMGVKWFTFHIGSLEAEWSLATHQQLTPEQIKDVHNQISEAVKGRNDIKVRCPIIYLECGSDEPQKWYCMHPERAKELLVMFTENGVMATHTPMASIYFEEFFFGIETNPDVPAIKESTICPISKQLSGRNDSCCRYISKYWNYDPP